MSQFHGSAYRQILRLRPWLPAYMQAPNFCASLVKRRMHSNADYARTEAKIRR